MPTHRDDISEELEAYRERFMLFCNRYMADHKTVATQRDFAEYTGIGMNRLSTIANGKAIPNAVDLMRICMYCGANADEILMNKLTNARAVEDKVSSISKDLKELLRRIEIK